VDISDQLYETLKALHTQPKKEAMQQGKSGVVPFIFHEKSG
jgi:hypothetical protein